MPADVKLQKSMGLQIRSKQTILHDITAETDPSIPPILSQTSSVFCAGHACRVGCISIFPVKREPEGLGVLNGVGGGSKLRGLCTTGCPAAASLQLWSVRHYECVSVECMAL